VNESQNGALKLRTTAGIDGRWAESFPDDLFAHVCSDEQRYAGTETVALLQQFVEEDHNEACNDELDNEENA
jgi:hypothetical protein